MAVIDSIKTEPMVRLLGLEHVGFPGNLLIDEFNTYGMIASDIQSSFRKRCTFKER